MHAMHTLHAYIHTYIHTYIHAMHTLPTCIHTLHRHTLHAYLPTTFKQCMHYLLTYILWMDGCVGRRCPQTLDRLHVSRHAVFRHKHRNSIAVSSSFPVSSGCLSLWPLELFLLPHEWEQWHDTIWWISWQYGSPFILCQCFHQTRRQNTTWNIQIKT